MTHATPDLDRARAKYRRRAGLYDRATAMAQRYRLEAVARLELAEGDRVVDVACGTGVNFDLLVARVGPSGAVVGGEPRHRLAPRGSPGRDVRPKVGRALGVAGQRGGVVDRRTVRDHEDGTARAVATPCGAPRRHGDQVACAGRCVPGMGPCPCRRRDGSSGRRKLIIRRALPAPSLRRKRSGRGPAARSAAAMAWRESVLSRGHYRL